VDYQKIKLTTEGGVATLTLNDPSTLNAAGIDLATEMAHALRALAAGVVKARALIVTGEGRGFCSGANLSGGGAAGRELDVDGKPDAGRALETTYNPLILL
jgi:2-(1,2-epoxy-1,2-dihydrophenyl)acetyl-CoA isomerase